MHVLRCWVNDAFVLQDTQACCKLASMIERGLATQLGNGLHAACEFLQERIRVTESPQMQHAAVAWGSSHITTLDAQHAVRACPHSGAVTSVWALENCKVQEAEHPEVLPGHDEETDRHCEQLCDWIVACADMRVKGGCKDEVLAQKVQALLRSGQTVHAFEALRSQLHLRAHSVVLWQLALRMSVASAGVKAQPDGPELWGYSSMSKLVFEMLKRTRDSPGCEALIPLSVAVLASMQEPLDVALTHMLKCLATPNVKDDGEHIAQVLEAVWCALLMRHVCIVRYQDRIAGQ
jgi:hypothetical protein